MIAANFYKHTEALRFQREMFFNGYKNQPRIMRLMQCVFDQRPGSPDWWTAAKAKARNLAKSVKKAIIPLFEKPEIAEKKTTWTYCKVETEQVTSVEYPGPPIITCAGLYRRYCPTKNHNFVVGGWTPKYSDNSQRL